MAREDEYIEHEHPEQKADLVINGTVINTITSPKRAFMRHKWNLFRAKLCAGKIRLDSSIQAQGTGEVMRRKWRISGSYASSLILNRSSTVENVSICFVSSGAFLASPDPFHESANLILLANPLTECCLSVFSPESLREIRVRQQYQTCVRSNLWSF
jgi:hypothetical protein